MQSQANSAARFTTDYQLILNELTGALSAIDLMQVDAAKSLLLAAPRVFVTGAGRSGLALKMAAMRLMHVGLRVHVVGEITTPAIGAGDLLLIASGSGTTASAVKAAEIAHKMGAQILAITTNAQSPLGTLATQVLVLPAATKQDHGSHRSQQYAGALFEQAVLLATDALFQQLWQECGETAEQLYTRHANLE